MRDKLKLTEQLVSQLPDQHKITQQQAAATWWYNVSSRGGMRLTDTGYQVLVIHLKLQFYTYKITDVMQFTQQTIIKLDRRLQGPYYIVSKKNVPIEIIFFDSKEAMMANLYGDLAKFIDNYHD